MILRSLSAYFLIICLAFNVPCSAFYRHMQDYTQVFAVILEHDKNSKNRIKVKFDEIQKKCLTREFIFNIMLKHEQSGREFKITDFGKVSKWS